MDLEGREYVFDYGDLVLHVRYLSATRLRWTQLAGPDPGSEGEQDFSHALLRPKLYFLWWWQEADASAVSQVVDLEARRVYTTWVSPDRTLQAFQGSLRAPH